jgi:uncharacterized protein (DUF2252 family)
MDPLKKAMLAETGLYPARGLNRAGQEEGAYPSQQDVFVKGEALQEGPPAEKGGPVLRDPRKGVQFVQDYNRGLGLSPRDLAKKIKMMKDSPFYFFRINPALFCSDLSGVFSAKSWLADNPAPVMTVNGDSHMGNFGTFRSPEGKTVWGLNDYDQSGAGSPEIDLERLATSALLAGRSFGLLSGKDEKHLVKEMGREYLQALQEIAGSGKAHPPWMKEKEAEKAVHGLIQAADKVGRKDLLEEFAVIEDSGWHFLLDGEKLTPLSEETRKAAMEGLQEYGASLGSGTTGVARPLQVLDIARKLGSGGSSFGLERYYVLAAPDKTHDLPVILEMKQLLPSAVEGPDASLEKADAARIVKNQDEMNALANPLTGSARVRGVKGSFLVREREPEKDTLALDGLGEKEFSSTCLQAARVMAWSHAGSVSKARKLLSWMGADEKQAVKRLADFAAAYADQTVADYREFLKNG